MRKKCKKISSDENETNTRPAPGPPRPLPRKNAGERSSRCAHVRDGTHRRSEATAATPAENRKKDGSREPAHTRIPFPYTRKTGSFAAIRASPDIAVLPDEHRRWTSDRKNRYQSGPVSPDTAALPDEYDSTRAKNRFCIKASPFDASGLFFPQALPPNMPQRPGTLSTGRGNGLRNGTDETPCRPKVWSSYHDGAKRKVASDSPFEDLGDKYVKRYAESILRKRPESSELRFPTFKAPRQRML